MRTFIVKFIPDDGGQCIIHKIRMPDYFDKGFYRDVCSWNWFQSGKKKGVTKTDRARRRITCCWSPTGLYYTHDWIEDEWEQKVIRTLARNKLRTDRTEAELAVIEKALDERNFPTFNHASIWDFYKHIGFDRKARKYV